MAPINCLGHNPSRRPPEGRRVLPLARNRGAPLVLISDLDGEGLSPGIVRQAIKRRSRTREGGFVVCLGVDGGATEHVLLQPMRVAVPPSRMPRPVVVAAERHWLIASSEVYSAS